MADIKIGEETFNVVIDGPEDAPVLMLSNSLGSNLHMWDPQIEELSRLFRVIRYDTRGHGGSAAPDGAYSIDQLGRDALAILDAAGVEKTHWLGLSMGGAIGQWLLANAPARIERAVLANTAAQFGDPDFWNERLRLLHEGGMASLTPGIIDRWFSKDFQESAPETIDRIRAALIATPENGYAGAVSALRDLDLRESNRTIHAPVLVIVGTDDPATPPDAGRAIAEVIHGAKVVELQAAHLSNIEVPEAFTQAVISFLTAPAAAPASFPRRRPARKTGQSAPRSAGAMDGHDRSADTAVDKQPAPNVKKRGLPKNTGEAAKAGKPARKAALSKTGDGKTKKSAPKTTAKKAAPVKATLTKGAKIMSATDKREKTRSAKPAASKTKAPASRAAPARSAAAKTKTPASKAKEAASKAKTPVAKMKTAATRTKTAAAKSSAARAATKTATRTKAASIKGNKSSAAKSGAAKTTKSKTVAVKKPAAKMAAVKKAVPKKTTIAKASPKKSGAAKTTNKKPVARSVKPATTKSAPAKKTTKVAAKKPAAKQTAPKASAVRAGSVKKGAAKAAPKAAARKPAAKAPAAKKPAAKAAKGRGRS